MILYPNPKHGGTVGLYHLHPRMSAAVRYCTHTWWYEWDFSAHTRGGLGPLDLLHSKSPV